MRWPWRGRTPEPSAGPPTDPRALQVWAAHPLVAHRIATLVATTTSAAVRRSLMEGASREAIDAGVLDMALRHPELLEPLLTNPALPPAHRERLETWALGRLRARDESAARETLCMLLRYGHRLTAAARVELFAPVRASASGQPVDLEAAVVPAVILLADPSLAPAELEELVTHVRFSGTLLVGCLQHAAASTALRRTIATTSTDRWVQRALALSPTDRADVVIRERLRESPHVEILAILCATTTDDHEFVALCHRMIARDRAATIRAFADGPLATRSIPTVDAIAPLFDGAPDEIRLQAMALLPRVEPPAPSHDAAAVAPPPAHPATAPERRGSRARA